MYRGHCIKKTRKILALLYNIRQTQVIEQVIDFSIASVIEHEAIIPSINAERSNVQNALLSMSSFSNMRKIYFSHKTTPLDSYNRYALERMENTQLVSTEGKKIFDQYFKILRPPKENKDEASKEQLTSLEDSGVNEPISERKELEVD
mmetsp:Transcript_33807/g.58927  ORF Transcript_33807/g.58927 Transcript_33807/m.58927 type:complete len:148 (-) Transcript_33807:33-476(-)